MQSKLINIERELNRNFYERKDVVRGLLVALLARQHILLIGPPGTGKSDLTEDLCSRIKDSEYFRWLVARTSTPEELYGPISLKALENDSYRRVTKGKLPEATIAFIDEIFKCNSAVLNGMLSILNERLFFNDGAPVNVPLETTVGASNELPEDREELGALWDRFGLRYIVGYIKDPRNFEQLLMNSARDNTTTITKAELKAAQIMVDRVDVTRIVNRISVLRGKMLEMNIHISDRRWRQSLRLVKANAYLEGRQAATDEDLEILTAALWQEPEQVPQVRQAIMGMANPLDQEALDLKDEAMEIWNSAMSSKEEQATAKGSEANAKLKKITKKLEELQKTAKDKGKSDARISEVMSQVITWNREVISKCLGISI